MLTVLRAAGRTRRCRPLTATVPKPLLPVGDRPLVVEAADTAVSCGASKLIIVVDEGAEQIRNCLGPTFRDVPVTYARQAPGGGTADAIRAARPYITAEFAFVQADTIFGPSLANVFERGPSIAVGHADAGDADFAIVTDGGIVRTILKDPDGHRSQLITAGAYQFPEEVKCWISADRARRGEIDLRDILERLSEEYDVNSVELETWLKIEYPWDLLEANEQVLSSIDHEVRGEVSPAATLHEPVLVGPRATVEPGVVIEGPVIVGPDAHLGPHALVRGHTFLGQRSHVGSHVEVENSVFMPAASAPHLSYVGDSILGPKVSFGAGTVVCNRRLDGEPVSVFIAGGHRSTDRTAFGVVAGEGAQTGINTTLDPGSTLAPGSTTVPGERVAGRAFREEPS